MRNLFKCLIFVIITIAIFIGITNLLEPPNMWDEYKAENKNSIDVLFFGSSHMYCAVNPVTIWQETGIPSYVVGAPEQPMSALYHYIIEAYKTQRPKIVAIELYGMSAFDDPNSIIGIPNQIKNIESMPYSINKIDAILNTTQNDNWLSLLLGIYRTHSRWKVLEKKDVLQEAGIVSRSIFKGHQPVYDKMTEPYIEAVPDVKKYVYNKGNTDYLMRSIEYCLNNEAEVLLFVTPAAMKKYDETYNEVASGINNVEYLNMNDHITELSIDNEKDWSDNYGHFNAVGARKISSYIGQYLKKKYNLPNKKEDPMYRDFLLEYELLLKEQQVKE